MNSPQVISARPVQLRGSSIARWILKVAGWRLDFSGLPARQGVLVIYPHTSNWDFPLGILAKWAIGIPVTFWGKDSLFKVPVFGAWLRWLGGVPVDRSAPKGIVADMVQRMRAAREADRFLWLALAPEGTRSSGSRWRSGFYQVAIGADVPVALAHFDFGRRRVGIGRCLRLCGDVGADMQFIADAYTSVKGCRPELAAPIRFGNGAG